MTANKNKNGQMGLKQTKKLLCNKGNREETTYRLGENTIIHISTKQSIYKVYKEFKHPYSKKTQF